MEKYAHIEPTVKLDMMPIALLFNKDSAIIKLYFAVLKKLQHVMRF